MRRALITIGAALLLSCAAVAQVGPLPGMTAGMFNSAGVTRAFQASTSITNTTSPTTFSSMALGPVAANRYVVLCAFQSSSGGTLTAATIGGISATNVASANNGFFYASVWIAKVPTGATGNVVLTSSVGSGVTFTAMTYAMYGNSSATPGATGNSVATPPSTAVSVPASSATIGCLYGGNGGTATWTNLTKDVEQASGSVKTSGASIQTKAAASVTVTGNFSGGSPEAMAVASWGP